jgi:thiol:disulfide interchange protein DsbD
MVALAASNFGLYQLRMPSTLMQVAGRAGEGAVGALFMGLTMGVVAAPCIGPIVVALLLFVGARQSAPLGFALFFTLGLGLGLPYVGLALAAGRLRRLPRGGAWLEWMERAFGFLLLAIALHFVTPLLAPAWVRLGWSLLLVSAGAVLGFRGPVAHPAMRWSRRVAGLAVVALGVGALLVAEAESPIAWTPYSDDALAHAAATGRPALVDFEATWCLPCREMDRTTFRDPAVVRAAGSLLMVKADVTGQDDDAAALMQRWAVPGVPTYVLLDRSGREHRRLVGLVSTSDMLDAMHEVARGG